MKIKSIYPGNSQNFYLQSQIIVMDANTRIFLKNKFKEYYSKNTIPAPTEIEKREFGVGTLTDKIRVRHKSFESGHELQNYLRREAPFYISYSIAYYEFPKNQPMKAKNWLGADIVFDLDFDMDFLNSKKFEEVRDEALNLIEFLVSDFGFLASDLSINFSGSKGYHIHLSDDELKTLGGDERREIVDYVAGDINFRDYLRIDGDMLIGPKKGDSGWPGRIYTGLYDLIENSCKDSPGKGLERIKGIGEKKAERIYENRKKILENLDAGRYEHLPEIITVERSHKQSRDPNVRRSAIKKVSSPLVQKIIEDKSVQIKKAEDTDKMVTIDISRLIRLPDTLHGGSGMKAVKIKNIEALEKFDPVKDAIAFGNEPVKIRFDKKIPKGFEMNDETFGPFGEVGIFEVPECVGVYLLLKGYGDIVPD